MAKLYVGPVKFAMSAEQTPVDFELTQPLPNVSFPLGRSFAGNLPVDRQGHPNDTLFFWAFEKQNGSLADANSTEPWGIWLNGGYTFDSQYTEMPR